MGQREPSGRPVSTGKSAKAAKAAKGTAARVARRSTRVPGEERRKQLVEVAVRLIGESGIRGTTMSRISGALGLSEMAAYRHFASKDELLMEANTYLLERILDWFRSSSNPVVIERLQEIGENHFDMLSADIDMFTAPNMQFLTMSQGDDPLHRHVVANNERMKQALEAVVQEGIAQGCIRADVDSFLFTHEYVGWFLAEDIHCLADLRDGTFSRSSHLRMLELLLRDVTA
jgi:AcrR family transcriptional regulator